MNDFQQRILQMVFDHFGAEGAWPFSREIAVGLREFGDYWSEAKEIDWRVFQRGEKRDENAQAKLTVEGISYCKGGEDILKLFVRALQFCVDRYFTRPRASTLSGKELSDHLELSPLQWKQLSQLLCGEMRVWSSVGLGEKPEDCRITFDPDIDRFNQVATIDDYLVIVREERKASATTAQDVALFFTPEYHDLPAACIPEFDRAMQRYSADDFTGAITSACGAVDTVTGLLYRKFDLGDPGRTAFAAKVQTLLGRCQVYERLRADLITHGIPEPTAEEYCGKRREMSKLAAEALAILRRGVGDVHGSKPASSTVAFDAIRSAQMLCAHFEPFLQRE